MLTKYASLESAQVLGIKGSDERRVASLDKFSDFEDYRTEDGFLYARIRAISSRVNKNHDGWPSIELAGGQDVFDRHTAAEGGFVVEADANAEYGFSTFRGKPIFVDHHNSNPERARGAIVDSKLHVEDHKTAANDPYYSSDSVDPEHLPGTWVELLLEVDAKSFPKLAKAIIEGGKNSNKGIDGFSMGCDVEKSICSICKNSAVSPDEYCKHIRLKGAHFDYIDSRTGRKTSRKAYENCYGVKFFEISAVFDPADETALLREVRSSVYEEVEPGENPELDNWHNDFQDQRARSQEHMEPGEDLPGLCARYMQGDQQAGVKIQQVTNIPPDQFVEGMRKMFTPMSEPNPYEEDHLAKSALLIEYFKRPTAGKARTIKQHLGAAPEELLRKVAESPLPQVDHIHAPEKIDTLREEKICPVCGSTMDEETCDICGYTEPPHGFDNPDLEKAKETDLKLDSEKEGQEELDGSEEPAPPVLQPNNPQSVAHVKGDVEREVDTRVAGRINPTEQPITSNGPATNEPDETIVKDETTPVTSSVRTAEDFIRAAGRNKETNKMEHTADAATSAPPAATPDVNVDTTGEGGVEDASNEQASKADAQVNVLDTGATPVTDVSADQTKGLPEAGRESDDAGYEDSSQIEAIPTKTWHGDAGDSLGQGDPVTGEPFPASEEGVKNSAWIVEGHDDGMYPEEDGGLAGGGAAQGTQPSDPVGKAEDRVDVLDSTTSPANNSGPTTTWSGTDGNGVTRQLDPVTNETLEGDEGVKKGSSAHLLSSFKLADAEIEIGLLDRDKKYERVAELESEEPSIVEAKLAYAQRVKVAGLRRLPRTAHRVPPMSRPTSEKEASTEQEPQDDPNFLFG